MSDLTPGRAGDILHVIEKLEVLEAAGKLRPAEAKLLSDFKAQRKAAETEVGRTGALYRGVAAGASLGTRDELTGAISALTGGDYAQSRDAVRAADREASGSYPEAFQRGRMSGTGLTAILPGVGTLKATQGMNLAARSGVSGLVGALTAGGQGFAEGEGGALPRLRNAATPGAIGAGFGAAAPLAAAGVGGLLRMTRNLKSTVPGISPRATTAMTRPIARSAASGQDIQAYLDNLGPEAMLADVPGNLQKTGQGLAAMPGEGGEGLMRALNQRATGSSQRIRSDVDNVLGEADAAFDARVSQARERSGTFGPMYESAIKAEGALDVQKLKNTLKDAARKAGPDTSSSLSGYIADLEKKAPNGLIDPEQLHWLRSDLSDSLQGLVGPSKSNALMTSALREMDSVLDKVPGYKAAREGYGNTFAIERSIDAGRQVFRGGEVSAMSPRKLREEIASLPPAQRDAFRKGAREWVDALMGTSRNDAAAAWGAFEKGWNDEKLKILLGDEAAERLIKRLRSEKVFSQTRNQINAGSQTEMRKRAADNLADLQMPDGSARPGPIRRGINAVSDAGNSIIDRVLYAGRQDVNSQVGSMLSMQGPARDALLQQLLREAMLRRQPGGLERALVAPIDVTGRTAGSLTAVSNN